MCGIWGFVGRDAMIATPDAWRGLCSLIDRGPDDWGVYVSGRGKVVDEDALPAGETNIFLGNRRLSILDLSSAGNQPMGTSDGSTWLIYNGEIYNYIELRETLRSKGHDFDSDCDTEVVLRAYEEFGADCVEHFRGMFAFAVWDKARGEVFVARDRFGIKPLYYTLDDQRFAFASQLTSLLEAGVSKAELDPAGVRGYLHFGFVPSPLTIVKDIEPLPPGTTLTYSIETGDTHVEQYWSPTFRNSSDISPDRMHDLLAESVRLRLRSDVPLGVFLSGGLDSSALVALMTDDSLELPDSNLHTFTIGFEEEAYSELEYAAEVADYFGTTHATDIVTGADVREHLPDIIAAMDQPMTDGLNTYFVSKLARDEGVRVSLSGAGADELFGGYSTFQYAAKLAPLLSFKNALPGRAWRTAGDLAERAGPVVSLLTGGKNSRKIADILRSDSKFGAIYLATRGLTATSRVNNWLEADADTTDIAALIDERIPRKSNRDVRDRVSFAELRWFMHDDILFSTDTMSMAHSLEVRLPFLDTEFADYVTQTDLTEDARQERKAALRSAMRELLPNGIADREKKGFTFPIDHWLQDELQSIVNRALSEELVAQTPLSYDAIKTAPEEFERNELHSNQLWSLVVLSLWIDEHIEPGDA